MVGQVGPLVSPITLCPLGDVTLCVGSISRAQGRDSHRRTRRDAGEAIGPCLNGCRDEGAESARRKPCTIGRGLAATV